MIWTTTEVAEMLRPYRGQRLLGIIPCIDCTEIVFEDAPFPGRPNLLTIFDDGRVGHGGVAEPESYARDADHWDAAA